MPLPFAAQLAIATAPSAIKLGANLLRGDEQSPYEQQMSSMADVFESQATGPITENQVYQEGKRQLDRDDEERRDRIDDSAAGTGATQESRLARTEQSNEVYADAMNRLMARARAYRDQMQGRYLNILGAQEQARVADDQRFQRKVNQFTGPLGQASQAFLLADMFGSNDKTTPRNEKGNLPERYRAMFKANNQNLGGKPIGGPTGGGGYNPWDVKASAGYAT